MLSKMLLASLPRARVRKLREVHADEAAAEPCAQTRCRPARPLRVCPPHLTGPLRRPAAAVDRRSVTAASGGFSAIDPRLFR